MCRPQMSTVIYWMSRRKIELSPRDKILEWGRIRTREHVQYASTYSESMVKNMAKKRESWSKRGPVFVAAAWRGVAWRGGVVVKQKLHQVER